MKKLIELGVAIDTAISAADEYDGGYNFERDRKIRDALMALPTVDAVEVIHGHWIDTGIVDCNGNHVYKCSVCGEEDLHDPNVTVYYCWHCGAKMNGKDGEQDG